MDSYSGIIIEESRRSEQFSDFTPIPCKGFNILCKAKRYGRWWVLKGLKEPYRQDENYKNLLHKEFDILISLQHPNIVSAYSMEEIPEMGTCIVMEWIDGITLEHWNGRKTEGEGIFLQLLDAVHYIHAKQIVHRDLKPSNIMITHNGNHVKLIDFGLSDTDDFAILKQPAGTPGYISPEQFVSQQADIRNDIFSIGCILEKILPGKSYTAIIKRCKAPIAQDMPMLTNSEPISWLAETAIHPVSSVSESQLWPVSSCLVSSVTLYCISRKRALASPRHITKPRRIQSSASKRVMQPHSLKANIPSSQQLLSHLLHPIYKAPNSYPKARRQSTRCGRNPA